MRYFRKKKPTSLGIFLVFGHVKYSKFHPHKFPFRNFGLQFRQPKFPSVTAIAIGERKLERAERERDWAQMANIDEERKQVIKHSVKKLTEERGGRGESSFLNNNNSSGSKEEGELTASDNDVNISNLPQFLLILLPLLEIAAQFC